MTQIVSCRASCGTERLAQVSTSSAASTTSFRAEMEVGAARLYGSARAPAACCGPRGGTSSPAFRRRPRSLAELSNTGRLYVPAVSETSPTWGRHRCGKQGSDLLQCGWPTESRERSLSQCGVDVLVLLQLTDELGAVSPQVVEDMSRPSIRPGRHFAEMEQAGLHVVNCGPAWVHWTAGGR